MHKPTIVAFAAGVVLSGLIACGDDDAEATTPVAIPTQVADLPDLGMDLRDAGIQVSSYEWPGHGVCIVFGEQVSRGADGVGVALWGDCDFGAN